jgi:hypothetical protein
MLRGTDGRVDDIAGPEATRSGKGACDDNDDDIDVDDGDGGGGG